MAIPFWDSNLTDEGPTFSEDAWDSVFIGGEQLPGICSVKGQPTLAFDKKKAGGVDGATITVNGYLPGPIEIEVLLWTGAQLVEMELLTPKIWRKPNKKTDAKELARPVSHPAFALWGITDVVVLGVSVPERGPVEGSKVIKIKCVEYVPVVQQPKTKTARGSSNVKLVKQLAPKNQAGEPPSKTDIHPGGKAKSRKGGVS
jgi:hypothetical protein